MPGQAPPETVAAVLSDFDAKAGKARSSLAAASDPEMLAPWTLKKADFVIFTMPRISALRSFVMNHLDPPSRPVERVPAAEGRAAAGHLRADRRRTVGGHPRREWRPDPRNRGVAAGLVPFPFVILSTLNSAGYRYGASDLAFYVPAVAGTDRSGALSARRAAHRSAGAADRYRRESLPGSRG